MIKILAILSVLIHLNSGLEWLVIGDYGYQGKSG